jgi:hypothetical protein
MNARLDPERWRKAEEVFGLAMEAAPEARERLVAEACGEDEALRQEVLSLLASADTATEYLSRVAIRAGIRPAQGVEGGWGRSSWPAGRTISSRRRWP